MLGRGGKGSRAGYETARLELARLRLAGGDARAAAMRQIAQTSARALGVDRVGIWGFRGTGGRLVGVCQFELASGSFPKNGLPDGFDLPILVTEISQRRVVYGIVKRPGGTILVDAAVGAGTTFRITLPRAGGLAPIRDERSG